MQKNSKKALYENIMTSVSKEVKKVLNERMIGDPDLYEIFEEQITAGIIKAWDDYGMEITHQDIENALNKLAVNYDVDKHISWAEKIMD